MAVYDRTQMVRNSLGWIALAVALIGTMLSLSVPYGVRAGGQYIIGNFMVVVGYFLLGVDNFLKKNYPAAVFFIIYSILPIFQRL